LLIKFSRTPGSIRNPPPVFAQDTAEVLAGFGFTEGEIEYLTNAGVTPVKVINTR
jgi:crotonobetainyl-CoA:carnitine CoA-transferase CaiB-like acyl-CoA transferase